VKLDDPTLKVQDGLRLQDLCHFVGQLGVRISCEGVGFYFRIIVFFNIEKLLEGGRMEV
jgi:hypothetical protein